MNLPTLFSSASVIFAAFAAFFWGWSSLVNLPVIGSAYGAIANLDSFYAALKKVARLNAIAAASAFFPHQLKQPPSTFLCLKDCASGTAAYSLGELANHGSFDKLNLASSFACITRGLR
jgi:hypothetical protein